MATKEMKVCDLCGKPKAAISGKVSIGDKEYGEVCDTCLSRLDTFIEPVRTESEQQLCKAEGPQIGGESGRSHAGRARPDGTGSTGRRRKERASGRQA